MINKGRLKGDLWKPNSIILRKVIRNPIITGLGRLEGRQKPKGGHWGPPYRKIGRKGLVGAFFGAPLIFKFPLPGGEKGVGFLVFWVKKTLSKGIRGVINGPGGNWG